MRVKVIVWIVWWGVVGGWGGSVVGGLEEKVGEVKHSVAPWNLWSVYSTAAGSEVTLPRPTTSSPLTFSHLRSYPTSTETREETREETEEESSYEDSEVSSWLDLHPTSKIPPEVPHVEEFREESRSEEVKEEEEEEKELKENKKKEEKKSRDDEYPAISSIRHHKSRKSFIRARKSSKGKAGNFGTTSSILSLLLSGEQGDEPVPDRVPDRKESSRGGTGGKHSLPSTAPPVSSDKAPLRLLRQPTPTSSLELGKMSSTNDTSVVYGRPYFTPSRKHNSTRMQRIKDLLSNASSPQLALLSKERGSGSADGKEESAVTLSVPSKSSRIQTNSPGPKNPNKPLPDYNTLLPPTSASALVPPDTRPSGGKSSRRKSKVRSSTSLPTSVDNVRPHGQSSPGGKGRVTTEDPFTPKMPGPDNLVEPPLTIEGHLLPHHLILSSYEGAKYREGQNEQRGSKDHVSSNFYSQENRPKGPKGLEEPGKKTTKAEAGEGETEEPFPYTEGEDGENKSRSPSQLFNDYSMLGGDDEKFIHSAFESNIDTIEEDAEEDASAPSSTTSNAASKTKPDIDIVTKFLRIVETQHTLGDNCTAGTAFSLGEGVVDRYAQERFRLEANVAVNRANMLTRLWKYADPPVLESEYLLHASLFSMIEFDDDIFAAGNCYDKLQYKNYTLFCPFAYRLPEGNILVKDLAVEYKYLSNTSEWFFIARSNAERVIKNYNQFSRGYNSYAYNESTHTERVEDEILNVTYEDGKWSKPYFDCGGGNIWMMTYTVPFFGYHDGRYFFKGTSGIDIDLRRVDIDQCPLPENSTELNIFAASDKCKNATTKCVPIKGLGFRRGSYRCECQQGYYFPNTSSTIKYFNGTVLEEEYEKKLMNDKTMYEENGAFECLRCLEGCDTCVDDRPCVVTLNWLMRSAILILQCAIIATLPIVGLFTWKYSDIKVVRAASPVLLRFIVLGAFLIYCTILVMYPSPSLITCTLRVWLREIGFSLAYGALMLKTWRISVIFRVRSAKAVKITDLDLMKRLGIIVAMFAALLVIRTLVAPPVAIVSLTADDLKAWLCQTDWWDHSFTFMELIFLVWGIRLCIVVRKAPSEFNESKFISLAIYNEFLLSVFLNISMLFLQSPANPDLLYIIFFCHVQLTMTLLLCLIFGSKAYMVFRGHGKGNSSDETRVPTFISKNRSGQKPKQPSGQNSTTGAHSSTTSTSHAFEPTVNSRLSEDVQPLSLPEPSPVLKEEEFRRLYYQLEELKERNMRLGNRHLVAKITAMQEAADSILSGPSPNCRLHQTAPQAVQGRDSKANEESRAVGEGADPSPNALSDITEEDNNSSSSKGGVVKKKRSSLFSRVKSTKRLMSTRSKSAKESKSSKASKSAQGSSEASDEPSGAKIEDELDERTLMAHGGVYIGEVGPITSVPGAGSSSSPGPSSSHGPGDPLSSSSGPGGPGDPHPSAGAGGAGSPNSSSGPQCSSGPGGPGGPQSSSGVGASGVPGSSRGTQGPAVPPRQFQPQQPGAQSVSQVLAEVQLHRADLKKSDLPVICSKVQEGLGEADSSDAAHCSNESPESIPMTVLRSKVSKDQSKSSDKNHSTDPSKILLDLNDKSRFTEEITV